MAHAVVGTAIVALPFDAHALGPITKGPWVQRVTDTSAVIRVEVNPPSQVAVELQLGPTASAGGHPPVESTEVSTLHALTVTGLQPGTRYSYAVRAGATSKFGSFVTAPAPSADASFRFLVYGDNRSDDAAHAAVVRSMVPVASEFLVHTGDFVERGGSLTQWQTFFDIESPLLSTRAHFSCIGNHELTDGAGIEYARYFGPTDLPIDPARPKGAPAATKPEHLDGTFRWGNARFFLLNGMVSYKGTSERAWIEKALTEADAEPGLVWRIVVVHHGPWSSGPHGGNARLQDAGVVQLLKEHKVDLVLSGHDHLYERGMGELPFIVSGGGGAPTYKVKKPIPESRKVESVHHFVDVAVSPAALQIVAMRADGSTLDRCSLPKITGVWDCDGQAAANGDASAPAARGGSASTSPSAPSSPVPRCGCDGVGAGVKRSGAMAGLIAAIGLIVLRRRSRTHAGTRGDRECETPDRRYPWGSAPDPD